MKQTQTRASLKRQAVEDYIVNHYQWQTYKEMGDHLNISKSTIQNVMRKYGLTKSGYDVKYYRKATFELKDLLDEFVKDLEKENVNYEQTAKRLKEKYEQIEIV